MKHSIYFRNFLATALIVLISFSLLGGLSTAWSYRRTMSGKREAMLSTLHETTRYVTTQYVFWNVEVSDLSLSMWLALASGISGFDLLVADSEGSVGACSERDLRHLGKGIPENILRIADNNIGAVMLSSLGQLYPERRQVTSAPLIVRIDGEATVIGYIFVSSDLETFRREWRQFSAAFILIALSVMVLAFAISFVATKKQAEPLKEMAGAARRFARGDFSMRVGDAGRCDEIGQLTRAFNVMADSLESYETVRREFIANLSHELKTPMTVITGFVDGILDGTIPPENEARYLGIISSETRRLSRLVVSMMDASKLQVMDTEKALRMSFDVSEVAKLALLSLDGKIGTKSLNVDAKLPEEPVIARGDKDSVTQVIYNLLDNAVKFSPSWGTISIELWKQGNRAYISVENRGETIPQEELPHIFDRFQKADKSRSADRDGVGLGLYIVKTILDNHNEDIYVTSGDGVTKFVFTLTLLDDNI